MKVKTGEGDQVQRPSFAIPSAYVRTRTHAHPCGPRVHARAQRTPYQYSYSTLSQPHTQTQTPLSRNRHTNAHICVYIHTHTHTHCGPVRNPPSTGSPKSTFRFIRFVPYYYYYFLFYEERTTRGFGSSRRSRPTFFLIFNSTLSTTCGRFRLLDTNS